jgi:hypothetical protein
LNPWPSQSVYYQSYHILYLWERLSNNFFFYLHVSFQFI